MSQVVTVYDIAFLISYFASFCSSRIGFFWKPKINSEATLTGPGDRMRPRLRTTILGWLGKASFHRLKTVVLENGNTSLDLTTKSQWFGTVSLGSSALWVLSAIFTLIILICCIKHFWQQGIWSSWSFMVNDFIGGFKLSAFTSLWR